MLLGDKSSKVNPSSLSETGVESGRGGVWAFCHGGFVVFGLVWICEHAKLDLIDF